MTDVPEARVQRRRFAAIWLVPIAAVAIAGWLGVKTVTQRGPLVTITFASAEGVEAGRTRIMLRNVEVGMVEFLDLSRDLSHVEVHARMRNDLKDHLTTGRGSGWSGRGSASGGSRAWGRSSPARTSRWSRGRGGGRTSSRASRSHRCSRRPATGRRSPSGRRASGP